MVLGGNEQKKEKEVISSINSEPYKDCIVTFQKLWKEQQEYKKSLGKAEEFNLLCSQVETQCQYPFTKFATSRNLIEFKDSLKNKMIREI